MGAKTELHFDRTSLKVTECAMGTSMAKPNHAAYYSQFIGVIAVYDRRYMILCQDCTFVAQILEMTIYKIDTVLTVTIDVPPIAA
jgi:hypothetical protein